MTGILKLLVPAKFWNRVSIKKKDIKCIFLAVQGTMHTIHWAVSLIISQMVHYLLCLATVCLVQQTLTPVSNFPNRKKQ